MAGSARRDSATTSLCDCVTVCDAAFRVYVRCDCVRRRLPSPRRTRTVASPSAPTRLYASLVRLRGQATQRACAARGRAPRHPHVGSPRALAAWGSSCLGERSNSPVVVGLNNKDLMSEVEPWGLVLSPPGKVSLSRADVGWDGVLVGCWWGVTAEQGGAAAAPDAAGGAAGGPGPPRRAPSDAGAAVRPRSTPCDACVTLV
eukprot:1184098-Prorocentrum_minimum.AAC.1